MRQFRFRKQTDGSVHLNHVHPHPSGLSNAKDHEETLMVLTPEELAATEHLGPMDPPTSDTSKAEGLSNALKPASPVPVAVPVVVPVEAPAQQEFVHVGRPLALVPSPSDTELIDSITD